MGLNVRTPPGRIRATRGGGVVSKGLRKRGMVPRGPAFVNRQRTKWNRQGPGENIAAGIASVPTMVAGAAAGLAGARGGKRPTLGPKPRARAKAKPGRFGRGELRRSEKGPVARNPAHYSPAAMAWYAGVQRAQAEREWYAGVARGQAASRGARGASQGRQPPPPPMTPATSRGISRGGAAVRGNRRAGAATRRVR